jgi:hypothetical protein
LIALDWFYLKSLLINLVLLAPLNLMSLSGSSITISRFRLTMRLIGPVAFTLFFLLSVVANLGPLANVLICS